MIAVVIRAALVIVAWLALAPRAAAQEAGLPYDPQTRHALAYRAADSPAWLPGVLARLRAGKGGTLARFDHILFRRSGQPTFLALIWRGGDHWHDEHLELYRVTAQAPSNVQLRLVRGDADAAFTFVQPTGDDAFGDGIPTLFIGRATGGNALTEFSLTVIRLIGATEDVSPREPLQAFSVEYELGRAGHIIRALDFRWTNVFSRCWLCGQTDVYLAWRRGRYVPACSRFPSRSRPYANIRREGIDPDGNDTSAYLEAYAEAALDMAQAGRTAEAIRYLRDAIARGRAGVADAESLAAYDADAAIVEARVGPVLAAAHANRGRPCPLSQLQVARREYGSQSIEDWLRTLRPASQWACMVGVLRHHLRLGVLGVLAVCLLALAPPVAAREAGREYDPQAPHALAYGARDAPAWLPRVLARLRARKGGAFARFDHILFRRGGRPTFLALIWAPEPHLHENFELYRVTVRSPSNVLLHFVRGDTAYGYALIQPTGDDAFGDGIPTLFLGRIGRSNIEGYRLAVIRLVGATEDVAPAGSLLPFRVEYDLGRPGHVITAFDFRWTDVLPQCQWHCLPTAAYFVWQRGRYVLACNRFSAEYEPAADDEREDIVSAHIGIDPEVYLDRHAAAALDMAQAGRTAEAMRYLPDAIARGRNAVPAERLPDYDARAAQIEAAVGRVLAAVHANRRRPCPLSQLDDATVEQRQRSLYPEPPPAAPR